MLKTKSHGKDISSKGIVFNMYPIRNNKSKFNIQVIFENGYFDKFSPKEQQKFLTEIDFSEIHSNYNFVNIRIDIILYY